MQSNDFYFEVARGSRTGFTPIQAFGTNGDVDAAEDIFAAGGSIPWAASAQSLEVLSSSTDDDGAPVGTGARTVRIEGVDADWNFKTQDAVLDGTSAVALTGTWLRVNKVRVLTAGSTFSNVGTITVRIAAAGATWVTIPATVSESDGAFYSVPNGYRLIVTSIQASVSSAGTITYGLFVQNGGVQAIRLPAIFVLANSPFVQDLEAPMSFGGQTDVAVRVTAVSASNQIVAGGIVGVLLSAAAV